MIEPGEARRRRARARLRTVALGLAFLLAVLPPLLLGGALPWGLLTITALALASLVASAAVGAVSGRALHVDGVTFVFLGALAYTGLQALPLPASWVTLWAPASVEAARGAARALEVPSPALVATSRDPGGTWAEVVRGFALAAAFMSGQLIAASGRRRAVLRFVALSTVILALVGLAHFALGAERVFGLHAPVEARPRVLAPLVNGNHLAGFLAMGLPLVLGLGLESRAEDRGVGWLLAAVPVGVVALMTLSRGGALAVLLGTGAMVVVARQRRRGARHRRARETRSWAVPLVVALIAVGGAYLAFDRLFDRIEAADLSKLELATRGAALLDEAPLLGIGRGAFSAVFAERYGTDVRFTHPENVAVLWTVEWGILVGPLVLFALAWSILRPLRTSRDQARIGAAVGLAVIGLQNLVDFGLELPGVSTVAALLLGAVVWPRDLPPARAFVPPAPQLGLGLAVVGACGLLLLGPRVARVDLHGVEEALRASIEAGDHSTFEDRLEEAMRAHPSEPALPMLAAVEASRRSDPSILRWINRAMQLAPGWAAPHALTAYWLAQRGRIDQALLEVREAESRAPGSTGALVCLLRRADPRPAAPWRAAPEGPGRSTFLDRAAACPDLDAARAEAIDRALLDEAAPPLQAVLRQARRELDAGRPAEARALLDAQRTHHPRSIRVTLLRVRAMTALGDVEGALRALREAQTWSPDRSSLLEEEARIHAAAGDEEGMHDALARLRGASGGRGPALAEAYVLEGDLERGREHPERALRAYEAAHRHDPDALLPLRKVASVAESLGLYVRAESAARRLCDLEGRGSRGCVEAARLRSKLLE